LNNSAGRAGHLVGSDLAAASDNAAPTRVNPAASPAQASICPLNRKGLAGGVVDFGVLTAP